MKNRERDISLIESNRVEQLGQLNVKYAKMDAAKSSLGYIACISLSLLFGSILLNDLVKLYIYMVKRITIRDIERMEDNTTDIASMDDKVRIEIDTIYEKNLENRLSRIHLMLLRSAHRPYLGQQISHN